MDPLFTIETDDVKLVLRALCEPQLPTLAGQTQIPAHLAVQSRQPGIRLTTHPSGGSRLFEETTYQLWLHSKTGRPVGIGHRDPTLVRDLQQENGGSFVGGPINFRSQIGRSRFSVLHDERPHFDFEVEVFPAKLDYYADYQRILSDVQEILTGLALEYLRATYQSGKRTPTPKATALEWALLLRDVMEELERSLEHVARAPVRRLRRRPEVVRAERIRRVDSAVRAAVRRGAGMGPMQSLEDGLQLRRLLPERRAYSTLDTMEHRWLAAQLRAIRRRLAWLLQEERERLGRRASMGPRDEQRLRELAQLEARVARLCRLEPLAEVEGLPPPGFVSMQLLTSPGYREAYRCCMVLSLGLRVTGGPLDLPVKDLSALYEAWCYLKLVQLVQEETGQAISAQDLLIKAQGLRVGLVQGEESECTFELPSKRIIRLRYNASFTQEQDQLLVTQRPDLLITIEDPGSPRLHLILDAKYRVDASDEYKKRYGAPGPPADALNVLHRYRDAILERDEKAGRVGHSVVFAAALFPLSRETTEGEHFRISRLWQALEKFGVGAIPLLPGNEDLLRDWLRRVLHHGSWSLAAGALAHHASERLRDWREAATEVVLVDVVPGAQWEQRMDWLRREKVHYHPHRPGAKRQFLARWVAFYVRTPDGERGAVRCWARVRSLGVQRRGDLATPWPASGNAEAQQVVYYLEEVRELPRAIGVDPGELPLRTHRWTSRLALQRARTLSELLLETEPEWQLYEDLLARRMVVRVHAADQPDPPDLDEPRGRAWLEVERGRACYKGGSYRVEVGGEAHPDQDLAHALALLSPA